MHGLLDSHSHILPGMDDGSRDVKTSLSILEEEIKQGVEIVCATSHYYPQYERPESFLIRRDSAYSLLKQSIKSETSFDVTYPNIILGAETYYFSGMRNVEELKGMCIGSSCVLLVELPFTKCTDRILDEIDKTHSNLHIIPLIAHVDRYMSMFHDWELPERILEKKMVLQFNANSIKSIRIRHKIVNLLKNDIPFLIGSDTHNMSDRRPNIEKFLDYLIKKTSDKKVERLIQFGKDFIDIA